METGGVARSGRARVSVREYGMKWIRMDGTGWDQDWVANEAAVQFALLKQDQQGAWWFDLASGNQLALVVDGGFRMGRRNEEAQLEPHDSRYRVFFRAAGGDITELTSAILQAHSTRGALDASKDGQERYTHVQREAVRLIDDLLMGSEASAPKAPEVQEKAEERGLRGVFGLRRRP